MYIYLEKIEKYLEIESFNLIKEKGFLDDNDVVLTQSYILKKKGKLLSIFLRPKRI